jgi:hypothetical protein
MYGSDEPGGGAGPLMKSAGYPGGTCVASHFLENGIQEEEEEEEHTLVERPELRGMEWMVKPLAEFAGAADICEYEAGCGAGIY